jgi:putative ABC transport system substrate-binding protein
VEYWSDGVKKHYSNTPPLQFSGDVKAMRKTIFIWLLATVFLATVSLAEAQQAGKVPRIGVVPGASDPVNAGPAVDAFRQAMREVGYIEGKNIQVEYRYDEGKVDQLPRIVAELIQLKVDVLVLTAMTAIRAAKQATQTIPVVMTTTQDPVATGMINSLARPGGNITGLTTLSKELSGKRLELLKEVIPDLSRVGVLWNPDASGSVIGFEEYETASRALKIQLQSLTVHAPKPDLDGAFKAAVKGRARALIMIRQGLITGFQKAIADLAIKNRLPLVGEEASFVESGNLMSYSASDTDRYKRAAYYVDRILKGAKPADLPVEQPTKFELVFNLKTAKQIGLTIPPNVLVRADRVIR